MTRLLLYVARLKALMLRTLPEISKGLAIIAHSENCARVCSSVASAVPLASSEINRHGSLKAPGPACAARFALVSTLLSTAAQSFESRPIRRMLPIAPNLSLAYHGNQPHSANRIGRPVALSASRIREYCSMARLSLSPAVKHESSLRRSTPHAAYVSASSVS